MIRREIIGFWITMGVSAVTQAAGFSGLFNPSPTATIPPPDQAFQWQRPNATTIEVLIADQVYLYDAKTHFRIDGQPLAVERPEGQPLDDPLFGVTAVHRGQIRFTMTESTQPIQIDYQGCADAGFCYPPMQLELSFSR